MTDKKLHEYEVEFGFMNTDVITVIAENPERARAIALERFHGSYPHAQLQTAEVKQTGGSSEDVHRVKPSARD